MAQCVFEQKGTGLMRKNPWQNEKDRAAIIRGIKLAGSKRKMKTRIEFSKRTKLIAWNRSQGRCERCTAKLYPGKYQFHHVLEATMSGSAEVANCQCVCIACHSEITADRAPVIAKSNRVRAKHIGIKKPRSIRKWKRFDGTPVFAPRER